MQFQQFSHLAKFGFVASSAAVSLGLVSEKATAAALFDVSEISGYVQIYQQNLPNNAAYGTTGTPTYNVNNSGTPIPGGIQRIGYYLELQKQNLERQWVWVSMDAFTQNLAKIGIPTVASGALWQQKIDNMNVESNVSSVVTGTGITTGNIEFWGYDYLTSGALGLPGANSGLYDFDDRYFTSNTYGSMQIHNWGARQTIFSYSAWGRPEGPDNLGIGNSPSFQPDWTFHYNADTYSLKNLEVWVKPAKPIPTPALLPGLIGLGLSLLRKNQHENTEA